MSTITYAVSALATARRRSPPRFARSREWIGVDVRLEANAVAVTGRDLDGGAS